jgi:hypothetical protein
MAQLGTPLMARTDEEKGHLVLDAFRSAGTAVGEALSALDLVGDFQDRELDPEDIEAGLAYANLQGWIEYGPNQSAILTSDGYGRLTND